MPDEYSSRMHNELNNPPSSPEDFRQRFGDLANELAPHFIEKAIQKSDKGQAEILHALGELSNRTRLMGDSIQPRTSPYLVDLLLRHTDTLKDEIILGLGGDAINGINDLRYAIVHTPDRIRELMIERRLITHRGERLLKRIDRESPYYRPPTIEELE